MGGAGDSPALVGDPPTGMAKRHLATRALPFWFDPVFLFRPAGRRTAQAGRLCHPKTIFQTRSKIGRRKLNLLKNANLSLF